MPTNQADLENQTDAEIKAKQTGASYIRLALFLLAAVFAVCVVMQVFLAGMASFVDSSHWQDHRSFVHYFEMIPLAMLVLTFIGPTGRTIRFLGFGMVILIIMQYLTAHMGGRIPELAALHPVLALLLFWISMIAVKRAFSAWRSGRV
ncbi:DUF6220 domain-containing protein [Paenibacillus sepulcri]|uniref:DoxX family protein n=1 Tax=Paenibacillus sepulcri TaxID=359917 RepID=A0ABS7C3G6_9BACL|nr:hypothetical protein [Paenibacillus sepulcri]